MTFFVFPRQVEASGNINIFVVEFSKPNFPYNSLILALIIGRFIIRFWRMLQKNCITRNNGHKIVKRISFSAAGCRAFKAEPTVTTLYIPLRLLPFVFCIPLCNFTYMKCCCSRLHAYVIVFEALFRRAFACRKLSERVRKSFSWKI